MPTAAFSNAASSISLDQPVRAGWDVLAHRGLWSASVAGNSLPALQAALAAGFGLETDVRDYCGELVIAHDPPAAACTPLAELFATYRDLRSAACLALNIKSCGLVTKLSVLLEAYAITNYFVFDMSVPDTLAYARAGLRFYSRQSEYEIEPAFYDAAAGIWLDAFCDEWFDAETIAGHLSGGKNVCIVSPELHRRDPGPIWEALGRIQAPVGGQLQICTDHPHRFSRTIHG